MNTTPAMPYHRSFFNILNYDVRQVIYQQMENLPPFGRGQEYAGFVLSCQLAKEEVELMATMRFNKHMDQEENQVRKCILDWESDSEKEFSPLQREIWASLRGRLQMPRFPQNSDFITLRKLVFTIPFISGIKNSCVHIRRIMKSMSGCHLDSIRIHRVSKCDLTRNYTEIFKPWVAVVRNELLDLLISRYYYDYGICSSQISISWDIRHDQETIQASQVPLYGKTRFGHTSTPPAASHSLMISLDGKVGEYTLRSLAILPKIRSQYPDAATPFVVHTSSLGEGQPTVDTHS
ncbi:hypothetical protein BS50DRAFT_644263 [Corynespora cassiicola Philippines]|uniref:Uncharacterized protein n=1 Tax=Corynespora cassiicola Philippines TaxID=1448308 RepID=A0A2T2PCL2_CORCC|nr:hypothetical protein BS50DRAFT_644263 [Corynespora cassiicola Philippines]